MPEIESRLGSPHPRRPIFKNNYHRRRLNITPGNKLSTKSCGHDRAVVRNVVELDGAAAYVCRQCFAYLRAVEFKMIVRRNVAALFRGLWPLGSIPGAAPTGVTRV